MQKTRPCELHRIRYKDCPNFKFLNHHCQRTICKKHLKLKLEIGGDDWQYGGDLDTLGGVESRGESSTENEDTIMEQESEQEQSEEEDDAVPEDIDYEEESRKKVFEWLKRNEELERISKR